MTNLIPPILDMVDEKRIAFTPAVELSYLNEVEQMDLLAEIQISDATPNLSQAQRLRAISAKDGLTPEIIAEIICEEKANQREMFKLPMEQLRKYVPKANPKQMQDFVIKALDHYTRYLQRQRERDSR